MYLAICAFVMASLTPILDRATDLSKKSYLTEAQHALDKSGELFQKSAEEMLLLPQKMNDFSAYRSLKLCSGALPKEYYADLYLCKKYMANQLSTLEHVDELFIYLPGSGVVLGKTRVFDDVYQYLNFDVVYQEHSPDEFLDFIASADSRSKIFPSATARVNMAAQQNYLTVIGRRDNDSAITGALFKESDLLALFNLPALPDTSFLYITDAAGELVYSYQYQSDTLIQRQGGVLYQGEGYSLISTQIAMPFCTVTLGIPNSYFEELHRPLQQMIFHCILTAILIGVLCSALFAAFNYLPIRRLEQFSHQPQRSRQPWLAKEYRSIENYMASSLEEIGQLRETAAEMRSALRSNLFIRLLYGSSEYSAAPELLPQLYQDYRVALFQISPLKSSQENEDYICYSAVRWLFEQLPGDWAYGQTDPAHAAVLIGPDPSDTSRIQALLGRLNEFLQSGSARASVGLSGRFAVKEELHTAFYHAQFSLAQAEESASAFYQAGDAPDQGQAPVLSLMDARRLYETIMACRTDEMDGIFDQIQQAARSGALGPGEDSIQAFYLVRTVLNMVISDARFSPSSCSLTPYDQSRPIPQLLDSLRGDALLLVDMLTQRQSLVNAEAKSQVMAYIQQNFQSPDIYAASIAETFHLSRNAVYGLVREQTGKSLNEYLEELRINQAVTMLKTTGLTVAEISAACGYNSTNTFYKVFKKRFGLSPSAFRQ